MQESLQINFSKNIMTINGSNFCFPACSDELETVLGKPEVVAEGDHTYYVFDEYGIVFMSIQKEKNKLKKCGMYTDEKHMICYVSLYFGDTVRPQFDETILPAKTCKALLTADGKMPFFISDRAETESFHMIRWTDKATLPTGSSHAPPGQPLTFAEPVSVSFVPKYQLGKVNYKLKPCKEEVLTFSDFNFKLAVIQVLMYEKELLEPYFNIYDFADKYRGKAINTESEKPIRTAVNFFKKLEIPKRLADHIEEIHMDGGNDIYMNLAPSWDGEDNTFDLTCVTEEELKQFTNLKKAVIMSEKYEELSKVFQNAGIEVS